MEIFVNNKKLIEVLSNFRQIFDEGLNELEQREHGDCKVTIKNDTDIFNGTLRSFVLLENSNYEIQINIGNHVIMTLNFV